MAEVKFTDYFQLLGVDSEASKDDIKKAFMMKALVYHPDKACDDAERTKLTAVYQDLQDAYRILSSDKSRQQYVDARQTTFLDFKKEDRDVGYQQSNLYRTVDEKGNNVFDNTKFSKSFLRDDDAGFQKLQEQYTKDGKLQETNIKSFMERRAEEDSLINKEVSQLNLGRGKEFDRNTFNRMFDAMKAREPGNGVQPYNGNPGGYFSSGGLVEDDRFGNLTMGNGFGFNTGGDGNLISGYQFKVAEFNVEDYRGLPEYGTETKLTAQQIADKLASHQDDRLRLGTMKKDEFVVEPSEIELAYSELFKAKEVEGLEAPVMLKK
jgi:curved DNA-binding protein CbpA